MPVQSNLFPDPPEPTQAAPPTAPRGAEPPGRGNVAPLWLQRVSLFILVIFCVYLGIILAVLPWWTSIWDHNLLLQSHPWIWAVLRLGFVRGVISGFGLLDIWIGISEAVNYRDLRP